ncbi:HAD-IA family hydrolase [Parachitinimonas caeni]|uniref:HAD-IA family hydrolase n=1 Tax=Parachitinimonas caeni TaxID=3031301 RepID=A0ABT7DZL7_9NEIS|nr:HAD-IA family hydrolase [Parachitinimonas caeni]MDK2125509.1 HAD-IA family hydrolase [Parachitinimonas caeni]
MAKRFDLIVFDWDGTLMDSTGTIVYAIQAAFRDAGMPEPSAERSAFVIGYGLKEAMQTLAPHASQEEIHKVVDAYRHHYLTQTEKIRLFEGVEEGIAYLKQEGYWLAVATGKSRHGLDHAMTSSGLTSYFDASRCADECHSKPHPQMLIEITDYLGVDLNRTLMIGDTTHDLNMARNAGAASVGMNYGAHAADDLLAADPLACFDNFGHLMSWLKENG